MKTKHLLILLTSLFFLFNTVNAQKPDKLSLDDLSFLAGDWRGYLKQLDYKDDSTVVTYPAELDFDRKEDKYVYVFSFTQPNGNVVVNVKNTLIVEKNKLIINGEEWKIKIFKKEDDNINFHASLNSKEDDGERPAMVVYNLMLDKELLTMRKMVRYERGSEFFVRTSYMMKKIKSRN